MHNISVGSSTTQLKLWRSTAWYRVVLSGCLISSHSSHFCLAAPGCESDQHDWWHGTLWSLVPTFAWSWHGHTAHHSHTSLYLLQSNLLVLVASAHDGHADYDWIQWSNKIPSFHWLKAQWCLAKECWSVLTVVWDGYPNIFVYINSTKQAHIPAYLCVMCCCVGPGFVGVSPLDELLRGDLWDHQGPPTSYTSSSLTSHIKLYCQPQLVPTFYAS